MKHTLPLTFLLFFLISCSKYQINTISSTELQKDPENGTMLASSDSFDIRYSFRGEDAPVTIEITNKLSVPLSVDWSKSALILNNEATSYVGRKMSLAGNIDMTTNTFPIGYSLNSAGSVSVSGTLPESISFIPPGTKVTRTLLNISKTFINNVPKAAMKKVEVYTEAYMNIARVASFEPENSPLKFQSYITLFTEKDNKVLYYPCKQEFYLSELVETYSSPQEYPPYKLRKDTYYVRRNTAFGTTAGVVGLVAATAAAGALSPEETQKQNEK